MKTYYYILVYSNYEEDADSDPFTVRYSSMEDAMNGFNQYCSDHLLSGQKAYNVCGPYKSEGE